MFFNIFFSAHATIEVGCYSLNNTSSRINEDRVLFPNDGSAQVLLKNDASFLTGVFDGHGGSYVSEFLCKNFEHFFWTNFVKHKNNLELILKTTFSELDSKILESGGIQHQGSTAVIGYFENSTLTITNLGDSRAAVFDIVDGVDISNDDISYTIDHKPDPETEEGKRILAHNGKIRNDDSEWRLGYFGSPILLYELAMSRAFGDSAFKKIGVLSEPSIYSGIKITQGKTCAIFATDGFWDGVNDFTQMANTIKYLKKTVNFPANKICEELAKAARKNESHDDITVVIIFF